jgi:hypothetical protein
VTALRVASHLEIEPKKPYQFGVSEALQHGCRHVERMKLMVRIQQGVSHESEYDRLDRVLNELCDKYKFRLYVDGWTRKTYDVFFGERKHADVVHLARIETLATTSGEIRFYDDRVLPFAEELGGILEADFGVREAVLIRDNPPQY